MKGTVFYLLIPQKYISSKQNDFEIKKNLLCLENIAKDFTGNNMKKQH